MKRRILIAGCPRSGTTALLNLLNSNGLCITNEWATFAVVSESDPKLFFQNKSEIIMDPDNDWYTKYSSKTLNLEGVDFNLSAPALMDQVYSGFDFYGDKWTYEYILNDIIKVFPDIFVVYIVRNPKNVVKSLVKSGISSDYVAAYQLWIDSVDAWNLNKIGVNYLEVRQEDMLTSLGSVCSALSSLLNFDVLPLDLITEDYESRSDFISRNITYENVLVPDEVPKERLRFLMGSFNYIL